MRNCEDGLEIGLVTKWKGRSQGFVINECCSKLVSLSALHDSCSSKLVHDTYAFSAVNHLPLVAHFRNNHLSMRYYCTPRRRDFRTVNFPFDIYCFSTRPS